jgi:hypothetical protein
MSTELFKGVPLPIDKLPNGSQQRGRLWTERKRINPISPFVNYIAPLDIFVNVIDQEELNGIPFNGFRQILFR